MIEGALGDAQAGNDVIDGGAVVAVGREQARGAIDDLLAAYRSRFDNAHPSIPVPFAGQASRPTVGLLQARSGATTLAGRDQAMMSGSRMFSS